MFAFKYHDVLWLKVGDLALSATMTAEGSVAFTSTRRMDSRYKAPEMWSFDGVGVSMDQVGGYRSNVDTWALGCFAYELVKLREPVGHKYVANYL